MEAEQRLAKDTIDGGPDFQRNLSREELGALVGADAAAALMRLPEEFMRGLPESTTDVLGEGEMLGRNTFGCFVRRYTRHTRPWIPFHCDSASVTVNVALNGDSEHAGGTLLGVHNGAVRAIVREMGEATVHPSTLLHAVTAMEARLVRSLSPPPAFTLFAARRWRRRPADAPDAPLDLEAPADGIDSGDGDKATCSMSIG